MVLTHFKTMVGSCLPAVVCRGNNVLFTLFVFACVYLSSTHIVLGFCFAFLRLVYPMLPVFLDFPFVIAFSVFSNVYSKIFAENAATINYE